MSTLKAFGFAALMGLMVLLSFGLVVFGIIVEFAKGIAWIRWAFG